MKKSPIYTRTGDKGMTSLVDGSRLAKNSVRIEAYGTVDELNSFIGVLIASDPLTDDDRALLTDIQARLFDIGSYLASGNAEMSERLRPRLDGAIEALEHVLDPVSYTHLRAHDCRRCVHSYCRRGHRRQPRRMWLALWHAAPSDGYWRSTAN